MLFIDLLRPLYSHNSYSFYKLIEINRGEYNVMSESNLYYIIDAHSITLNVGNFVFLPKLNSIYRFVCENRAI